MSCVKSITKSPSDICTTEKCFYFVLCVNYNASCPLNMPGFECVNFRFITLKKEQDLFNTISYKYNKQPESYLQ